MSFVDKLKAVEEAEKKNGRGASRVSVLARWPDINAGLEAGYSVKTIWKALQDEGAAPVTYARFAGAVKQQLARLADAEAAIRAAASAPPSPGAQGSGQPRSGPRMGRAPEEREFKPYKPKPLEELV